MLGFDTRTAQVVWTVFLVAILLFFVYAIRQTLLVVTFAIFFSYMVYPLIAWAERRLPPPPCRAWYRLAPSSPGYSSSLSAPPAC